MLYYELWQLWNISGGFYGYVLEISYEITQT